MMFEKICQKISVKASAKMSTDNEQCKQLWFRIKRDAKKKHDGKVMNFKRTCAKTGGGQAPQPPPEIDGDDIDPLFADPVNYIQQCII